MELHNLKPQKGARTRKQRVGRGMARKGKTSGRGMKGQRARSGGKSGLKLKGMRQTLLRVPKKRGFSSGKEKAQTVNLSDLDAVKGAVSPKTLKNAGLVANAKATVKILGRGDVKNAVVVRGCKVSDSARKKIEAAGGKVQ